MTGKISMNIDIGVNEMVYAVSLLTSQESIEIIKEIEKSFSDWDVTERIAKHYVEEISSLYKDPVYTKDQPQDKKEWIDYLQSQIDALS